MAEKEVRTSSTHCHNISIKKEIDLFDFEIGEVAVFNTKIEEVSPNEETVLESAPDVFIRPCSAMVRWRENAQEKDCYLSCNLNEIEKEKCLKQRDDGGKDAATDNARISGMADENNNRDVQIPNRRVKIAYKKPQMVSINDKHLRKRNPNRLTCARPSMLKNMYRCKECNKTFDNQGNLTLHQMEHEARNNQHNQHLATVNKREYPSLEPGEVAYFTLKEEVSEEGTEEEDSEKDERDGSGKDEGDGSEILHRSINKPETSSRSQNKRTTRGAKKNNAKKIKKIGTRFKSNDNSAVAGPFNINYNTAENDAPAVRNVEVKIAKALQKNIQCRSNSGEKIYKCNECHKNFMKRSHLVCHLRIHTGEKFYQCNECKKTFNREDHLLTHLRTHTGEKPYKCNECKKSFTQESNLRIHFRTHTGEKPYKCKECKKTFTLKGNLITHLRIHTGEKPYKCNECKKTFTQESNLHTHLRTHTGEKPYQCSECKKTFIQESHLRSHLRTHTGEKPYKCKECKKTFTLKGNLITHLRIHTGEKPYQCNECKKTFNREDHLRSHLRTHTGEKPYKCNECYKKFINRTDLIRHLRVHTGEKPYKCNECKKTFNREDHLRCHLRTHTGEKPYKCNECKKSFANTASLRYHLKKHIGRNNKCKKCD